MGPTGLVRNLQESLGILRNIYESQGGPMDLRESEGGSHEPHRNLKDILNNI